MRPEYPVDYHIHYHIDSCAGEDMTLQNIEQTAYETGLREIGVVKHCSETLPGGGDFAAWHIVKPDEFRSFLADIRAFSPNARMPMYAGVETELTDETGTISVTGANYDAIDHVMLSVHYMPNLSALDFIPLYHPRMQKKRISEDETAKKAMLRWQETIEKAGTAAIVEGLATAYCNAAKRFDKICAFSHMYDGLFPLRDYNVPCDSLPEADLIAIFEPMMRIMAEKGILWELLPEPVVHPAILKRANELGVRFLATADSHTITGGWGNLVDHYLAEEYIDSLGLTRGKMRADIAKG